MCRNEECLVVGVDCTALINTLSYGVVSCISSPVLQKNWDMESKQESGTSNDKRETPQDDKGVLQPKSDVTLDQKSPTPSSSFSPASSLSEPFELDTEELRKLGANFSSSREDRDAQLASDFSKDGIPVSSTPRNQQSSDGLSTSNESATQFPPTQVMDRAEDSNSSGTYRIPSHVFDRSKSNAPVEWSVASNESLFSIHMGNMSFTREQFNWLSKSGELGLAVDSPLLGSFIDLPPPPSPRPPSPRPPPPPDNPPPSDAGKVGGTLNQGIGKTEAAAAETMRQVIRENNGGNLSQEKLSLPKEDFHPATLTPHSDDASTKSFAFPILTGDLERSGSLSMGKGKRKKHSHSQPPTPKEQAESQPQTPKQPTPKAVESTPKAVPTATKSKWFSCFSCCSCC